MKAIQVMMDEALLEALDATAAVQRDGRSAVLRQAAADYLARRRDAEIGDQYRRAYAGERGLGPDFDGWEEQGSWPAE
jgi:metal-responsive CopG/Arc/MetJ family transcriptional regulator